MTNWHVGNAESSVSVLKPRRARLPKSNEANISVVSKATISDENQKSAAPTFDSAKMLAELQVH